MKTEFGITIQLRGNQPEKRPLNHILHHHLGWGDSGVSDCESSSNHNPTLDSSTTLTARLSNIRSLRLSSITLKKTDLIVQDIPLKKSFKPNLMKSQLLISSNSALTQIMKKKQRQET
ncbi:unnamed protein product [Adineta steineri]|uniref:Uncharacterized protein n=1 Tax=Adineta steineri TaxID=433720 RepID=A0A815DB74_9BILA|nr:unnamed protein product [Adineta steineri]CAF3568493.1 unnamed protein product [Adineta steineri]